MKILERAALLVSALLPLGGLVEACGSSGHGDSLTRSTVGEHGEAIVEDSAACTHTRLTVRNHEAACDVTVGPRAAVSAEEKTYCVLPGTLHLKAKANPGSVLGKDPWHDTTTESHGTATLDVAEGTGDACVWVCCPGADASDPCPRKDPCEPGDSGGAGSGGAAGSGGTGGSGGSAGTGGTGGAGGAGGSGGAGTCLGSSLLDALGKNRLMVGLSGSSTALEAAPYDLQYIYISGGLFTSTTPCTACGSSCSSSWWGCYNTPPGMYATYFMQGAAGEKPPQIPMFTYYEILQTAEATFTGFAEGTAEATQAATSVSLMTRYFNDWRFLLQQIGQSQAFLHIEPDFWGYARQAGDPTSLGAAVATANPTDCASLPNTIAGMGQCMIKMVRTYAPKAFVGLHASAWNIASNTTAGVDVTTDAKEVATFLAACGQNTADFVVVETSDRDAGYYQIVETQDRWWDPTDTTLPDYQQDLTWIKALTEALGTPALYWQTPIGDSNQNNTDNHYQDNRVDYFFGGSAAQVESGPAVTVPSHWSELAAAHVVGVAFGAGAGLQTTADSDSGHLASDTTAYVSGGGQALCP